MNRRIIARAEQQSQNQVDMVKHLKKEEESKENIIDTRKAIKDLEAELDYMYMREPDDLKYTMSLERELNKLYEKLNKLEGENN
jgi:vacuolar-type H+-ATPase subunit I/STV1